MGEREKEKGGGEREREREGGLDKEECGLTYRVMVSCRSLLLCSHSLPWSPPFDRLRRNKPIQMGVLQLLIGQGIE